MQQQAEEQQRKQGTADTSDSSVDRGQQHETTDDKSARERKEAEEVEQEAEKTAAAEKVEQKADRTAAAENAATQTMQKMQQKDQRGVARLYDG